MDHAANSATPAKPLGVDPGAHAPLVARTAWALSRMSQSAQDGEHLGSEAELLERLGVSRPTLRQAAKIVESDNLITVRRGPHGGFFAARPGAPDAIRAPALFLSLNGATVSQVHAVARLVLSETAVEAAHCRDEGLCHALQAIRAELDTADVEQEEPAATLARDRELAELLGRMSGNPALILFVQIGYAFGSFSPKLNLYQSEEVRRRTRISQRAICDAVLGRDGDVARLMMDRRSDLVGEWIRDATEREAGA